MNLLSPSTIKYQVSSRIGTNHSLTRKAYLFTLYAITRPWLVLDSILLPFVYLCNFIRGIIDMANKVCYLCTFKYDRGEVEMVLCSFKKRADLMLDPNAIYVNFVSQSGILYQSCYTGSW